MLYFPFGVCFLICLCDICVGEQSDIVHSPDFETAVVQNCEQVPAPEGYGGSFC